MNQDPATLSSTTTCRPAHVACRPLEALSAAPGGRFMQDPANGLRRILLPRTRVNKASRTSVPAAWDAALGVVEDTRPHTTFFEASAQEVWGGFHVRSSP